MALNPSIILGLNNEAPKIPDPIDQYVKGVHLKALLGQGELQDLQTQQARKAIEEDQATGQAYKEAGGDPAKLRARLQALGLHKQDQAVAKFQLETRKEQGTIDKTQGEILDAALKRNRDQLSGVTTPQAAAQWVQAGFADPVLAPLLSRGGTLQDAIARIPQDPAAFQEWKIKNGLGIEKAMEMQKPDYKPVNTGGSTIFRQTNPYGTGFDSSAVPHTQSPDSLATDRRPHYDTTRGGFAAPPAAPGAPAPAAGPVPAAPTAPGASPITNPGNLRPVGANTGFQKFDSPEAGIAALDTNLQAYGKRGINTLEGIIGRWAPPNENDTPALIRNAAQRLGIASNTPINLADPVQRHLVSAAIMLQENGPKRLFAGGQPATAQPAATPAAAPAAPAQGSFTPVVGPDGKPVAPKEDWQNDFEKGVQVNMQTGATRPIMGPDGKTPLGPKDKDLTDSQAKAHLYATRMEQADKILSDLAGKGVLASVPGSRGSLTGPVITAFMPDDRQSLDQAKRNFINAVLRRESGAVISPSEFENGDKQYFPQIGDGPKTIENKAANRRTAIDGIRSEVPQRQQTALAAQNGVAPVPRGTDPQARTVPDGEPTGTGRPIRIAGDDGYSLLPKGALFIGPDGKTRRKP